MPSGHRSSWWPAGWLHTPRSRVRSRFEESANDGHCISRYPCAQSSRAPSRPRSIARPCQQRSGCEPLSQSQLSHSAIGRSRRMAHFVLFSQRLLRGSLDGRPRGSQNVRASIGAGSESRDHAPHRRPAASCRPATARHIRAPRSDYRDPDREARSAETHRGTHLKHTI